MNSGSVLSFQVSTTCGLRPNARQIRETDDCDRPVSAAIDLVDQWLSWPRPFSVRVRVTRTSTCSSVIFRAAPGRGASPRPSSRRSMNRTRHWAAPDVVVYDSLNTRTADMSELIAARTC